MLCHFQSGPHLFAKKGCTTAFLFTISSEVSILSRTQTQFQTKRNLKQPDKNPNVYKLHWNLALACFLSWGWGGLWRTDEAATGSVVSNRAYSVNPKHPPRSGRARRELISSRERFLGEEVIFKCQPPIVNGATDWGWLVRWSSLIIWSAGRWPGGWPTRWPGGWVMYTGVLVHIATFANLILSQYQVAALVHVIVNNGVASNRGGGLLFGELLDEEV